MTDTQPTQTLPPTPPPTTPDKKNDSRWSFSIWRLVIGLLIVLFGAQLLAQNYGWDWSINLDITRLWPIVLILIGISMITKGHVISTVVGSVLAMSVIGIAAVIVITQPNTISRESYNRTIEVAKEITATSAEYTLDLGAADIEVTGGANNALSGNYESNVGELDLGSRLEGAKQKISIGTKNERRSWIWLGGFKNDLSLKLPNDLPLELDIDSGAANLNLDFSTVQTREVTIDAGASSIDLTVGDLLETQRMTISSGASSIDVAIPKTITGVRLNLDAGLSGKTLPSEFKKISDELYETVDYGTADKKLDLSIDAGASSINITWK